MGANQDDDEDDDDDEEEEIKVATEHAKSLFDQKIRATPTRNIFLAVQPLTCEEMFPSKILGVLEDMLEKVFQGIEAFGLLVKVNIVFQRRNEIGEPTDEDPTPAVLCPFVLMRPDLIFASRTREMIVSEIAPRPDPQSPQLYARQPPRQDSETRLLPRGQLTEPQRFIRLVLHNLPPQSQQPCAASWACFEVDAVRLDDDDVTYVFLAQQQIFHWLMQLLFPRYFASVPPNTITRPCHDNPSEVELLFGNSFSTFDDADAESSSDDDESSNGDDDSELKKSTLDRVVENLPSAFSDAPPMAKITELTRPTEVKTVGANSRKPLAAMTSQITTLPSNKTTTVGVESGKGQKFIKQPKNFKKPQPKPPGPRPPTGPSSRKHSSSKGGQPQGIAQLLHQNGLRRIPNAGAGNCLPICLAGLLHNDDGSEHHMFVRSAITLEILTHLDRYRESLVDEDFQEAQMTVETDEERRGLLTEASSPLCHDQHSSCGLILD